MSAQRLLFISPRFLLPVDSGGKIRTTQTLRGLKGGRFHIRLLAPATEELVRQYRQELEDLCDEFQWWPQNASGSTTRISRARHLFSSLPIPIASDYNAEARRLIARELARETSVVVFDFLHSVVLAPPAIALPSLLFTHNVEAEIFQRHEARAANFVMRSLWRSQLAKMFEFERSALQRFDVVVAVSERDGRKFQSDYGLPGATVIPTGVDPDFYGFHEPDRDREIVFCGSMDWLANQEAIQFFLDDIWPLITRYIPDVRMTVVGRAPPDSLQESARRYGAAWKFTGFVEDVRPYVQGAAVSVIPMRIAGGTRLKVYEAMAMGPVVVSTHVGVEGLPVVSGEHCLIADDAAAFAAATVELLQNRERRFTMSRTARAYVQNNFGYRTAARVFANACSLAIERFHGRAGGSRG